MGFNDPKYSDMTVKVTSNNTNETTVILVNSLLMVSVSEYFDAMLSNTDMKESKERVLEVGEIHDTNLFIHLLRSAYSRDIGNYWNQTPISEESIPLLAVLADRFCFQETLSWVEKTVVKMISSNTGAYDTLGLISTILSDDMPSVIQCSPFIIEASAKFLVQRFPKITDVWHPNGTLFYEFTGLSLGALEAFLSSNNLELRPNEDDTITTTLAWIYGNKPNEVVSTLKCLSKHFRFRQVSGNYLMGVFNNLDAWKDENNNCYKKEIMDSAVRTLIVRSQWAFDSVPNRKTGYKGSIRQEVNLLKPYWQQVSGSVWKSTTLYQGYLWKILYQIHPVHGEHTPIAITFEITLPFPCSYDPFEVTIEGVLGVYQHNIHKGTVNHRGVIKAQWLVNSTSDFTNNSNPLFFRIGLPWLGNYYGF